jgi:hypothetical protein
MKEASVDAIVGRKSINAEVAFQRREHKPVSSKPELGYRHCDVCCTIATLAVVQLVM